jgi:hypothetical protein
MMDEYEHPFLLKMCEAFGLGKCLMIGIRNHRSLTFGNSCSAAVDDKAVVAVRATRHERRSIGH